MDRKKFIGAAAIGGVGAMAVTSVAPAVAATPSEARLDALSNRNIQFMITIIQAVVDDLNGDEGDYGGHRVQAMARLREAINQLQAALQSVRTHGQ